MYNTLVGFMVRGSIGAAHRSGTAYGERCRRGQVVWWNPGRIKSVDNDFIITFWKWSRWDIQTSCCFLTICVKYVALVSWKSCSIISIQYGIVFYPQGEKLSPIKFIPYLTRPVMISSLIGAVHPQNHLLLDTDIQGAKLYFAHKGLNYRLAYMKSYTN